MKKIYIIITFFIFLSLFLFSNITKAQFYNGHQMTFGKNRVQYYEFDWQYFRFDDYDIYYNIGGEELSKYTSQYLDEYIPQIETFFGYALQNRIILIVYNTLSDFRQSNIGLLSGNLQFNVGGVTQISNNKVFLYYESDQEKFKIQIKKAIAQVVLNEMLYGEDFKDKITNSTLISLPEWFEKGLIDYVAEEWNFELENKLRDGILSGRYNNINHLKGEDAVIAGHSIWYYIAQEYGADEIPNIIYLTRVNKNADSGLMYVLGASSKYIAPAWLEFFKLRFNDIDYYEKNSAISVLQNPKKNVKYQNIKINPKNDLIAFSTNNFGKYKIFVYDNNTKEIVKILKEGQKIDQITDYSYPLIAWHPTGKMLSYLIEKEGAIFLYQYILETEELKERKIIDFTKVIDYSYSDDGKSIVVSAVKKGVTDIYVLNIAGGIATKITDDAADDLTPRFIENSTKIIFSSNRISDTLKSENFDNHIAVAKTFDIFIYDLKTNSKVLTRITDTKFENETRPFESKKYCYTFLSDKNGVKNLYTATFDSIISFIDTTTHYRYFTTNYALTNNNTDILDYDICASKNKIAKIFLKNGKYFMYQNDFKIEKDEKLNSSLKLSEYRKLVTNKLITDEEDNAKKIADQIKEQTKNDSIAALPLENFVNPDSLVIDINNYVFEIERETPYKYLYKKNFEKENDAENKLFPKPKLYLTNFYMNYVVNQVDFGTLSESYQPFTGGPFYFNPGLNLFFKLGVNDLFEDYKIVGGFRYCLNSNEFLLSLEDLDKRLDRQYMFHRQTIKSGTLDFDSKIITNEVFYIMRYPFNQVSSLKTTFSGRFDKALILATDYNTMVAKNQYQVFSLAKVEYIYDNTFDLGANLYNGIRAKFFGEFYQQVEGAYDNVAILGCDLRYYKPIHRSFIFATRFAASTSLGTGNLIYYLGGVDNWNSMSLFQSDRMFDTTVNINKNINYIYQAVATNMRGFRQNARNGNSFALINSELRMPIFKYFANRPLNSDFFNNFQIVGFFDVGSAWTGFSPLDKRNAYNQVIIPNGPVTVYVDVDRSPVIAGYGWGVRSKLFGYFFRLDWAWGIESYHIMPRMFYFSLNLDF